MTDDTNEYRYALVDLTKNERHVFTDIPSVAGYLRVSAAILSSKLKQVLMFQKRNNETCAMELDVNTVLYFNANGVPTDGAVGHELYQAIYALNPVKKELHCFDNVLAAATVTGIGETSILAKLESKELTPLGSYFFSHDRDELAALPLLTDYELEALSKFENTDPPHILIFGTDVGSIESYESPIAELVMSEYDGSEQYMIPWKPGIIGHPVFQALKETTHMFKNMREQICFILDYTSGDGRASLLAMTEEIYADKTAADNWLWFFKEIWLPPKWMDRVTKMHEVMTEATEEETL